MKVAVVTPYLNETEEVLRRCHLSVSEQTHPATHFMVADGSPRAHSYNWPIEHLVLSRSHNDGGCTPRAAGAICALNQGFDAVAFLDADNWYLPEHVDSLVRASTRTNAGVAFSDRRIILASGEECPFEDTDVAERRHADTSCHFVTSKAAWIFGVWGSMGPDLWPLCDRIVLQALQQRCEKLIWTGRKTVAYLSRWGLHYKAIGKLPPPDEHRIDWAAVSVRLRQANLADRFGKDLDFENLLQSEHNISFEGEDDFMSRLVPVP